ncbi:uncharacterized protein LOC125941116 [Dermacentor silvarum]|uniref:uncharacterized protein LOC125941116 n=1 Tax=Dermacentor silvarum TaxID=543639 RepID=UPI002100C931|nr:uncharacterized protein LOC125941116 [Dermacentor silvarum]
MPLYVVLVKNSNGESEIVALILCAGEDEATLQALFSRFNVNNRSTTDTKVIMTDKYFVKRKTLKTAFPCAASTVCLFHVLRTFRREVTVEETGVTSQMRMHILELLQKLCYSQTEEEYQETYKSLQNTGCAKVLQYFNKNWHPIGNEWVKGFKHQATTFGNSKNNRVEAINQKIMQAVKRYAPLHEMFSDLLTVMNSLHLQRDQTAMEALLKAPVVRNLTRCEQEYCNILTPYAFAIVSKELKKANEMDSLEQYAHLEVSEESCSCCLSKAMRLPCRHTFFYRKELGLPMFFDNATPTRWTRSFYSLSCRLFTTDPTVAGQANVLSHLAARKVMSECQKHRQATVILLNIATLVVELPMRKYQQAMELLKALKKSIEERKEVYLVEIATHDASDNIVPIIDSTSQPVDIPASSEGTTGPVSLPTREGAPAAMLQQACSASGQPMAIPAPGEGTTGPVSLRTHSGRSTCSNIAESMQCKW